MAMKRSLANRLVQFMECYSFQQTVLHRVVQANDKVPSIDPDVLLAMISIENCGLVDA